MGPKLSAMILAAALLLASPSFMAHARGDDGIVLTIDARQPSGGRIRSPWDTLARFVPRDIPRSHRDEFPMIKYVCFFNATGGRPDRPDLALYDEDAEGRPSYRFERLTARLDTVIAAGFTPYLALSGTPVKLASDPEAVSPAFKCNTSPPADWGRYYDFVQALFEHLSARYGAAAVAAWRFRCMTEPDNRSWWSGTMDEWFRFYDHTVSAARSANPDVRICPGNLMRRRTPWLTEYARRVEEGVFSIPGETPYVPPMVTFSFYRPWRLGQTGGPMDLVADMKAVRAQLAPFPSFDGISVGIDEGYVGVDEEDRVLWGRLDGTHLGAAYFAMLCEKMVDQDVASAALWEPGSSEVPTAARNVLDLFQELMVDTHRVGVRAISGSPSGGDQLGLLAGTGAPGGAAGLRIMLYNYNRNRQADEQQAVLVRLRGLPTGPVRITRFIIDREHANYRLRWLADSAHLTRKVSSRYDVNPLSGLGADGRELWRANKTAYRDASRVTPTVDRQARAVGPDGELPVPVTVRSNSVLFLVVEPSP